MSDPHWHIIPSHSLAERLETDAERGLSSTEAAERLTRFGPNRLREAPPPPAWRLFLAQFQDLMVVILLGATAISFLLGETVDAVTIVAIVVLNAVLGFLQEYRAERSLEALRRLTAPTARVVRDGEAMAVPASGLVPGDLVRIEAGDRVPADLRLLQASGLEVEEAALTGESMPVRKRADARPAADAPVGDRRNSVFMGTTVTRGRGRGIACATGMQTEMGRIAGLIQSAEQSETPLQRRLEQLGRALVLICLGVCAVVVAIGIWRNEPVLEMFLSGVSLAVAAIPEGLPAVVTIGLALGVQRMIKGNAIVRKLPAVETLGCATVICSDKTGTLTKNEMTVKRVFAGGRLFEVSGEGYRPWGEFTSGGRPVPVGRDDDLGRALLAAALCGNARVRRARPGNGARAWLRLGNAWRSTEEWQVQGDPTEAALVVAAAKAGLQADSLAAELPRVGEIPFESERRRMTVVVRGPDGLSTYVKGAPDALLPLCTHEWRGGRAHPLDDRRRRELAAQNEAFAREALRVLAIAYRRLPGWNPDADPAGVEQGLTFLGLAGMIDPPRPEAVSAIARCRSAGLRVVMITGDHAATAVAIARQMGLLDEDGAVLTGPELDRVDDAGLERAAEAAQVYARVSPQHKLRIVRALKRLGHIVAMTGDGVNDAPAVKEADIGVAMGRTGTDVTKEASAMVLADDNFATIVTAVAEGRSIYDNIRKFIRYLLSCNTGEVLTMFLAAVVGLPLPLLPVQILWVNLVTDGLPAVALGVDPADPDVMARPPRRPNESIFSRGLGRRILMRGVLIGLITVGVFAGSYLLDGDLRRARTLAFATLVMCQLFHAFDCRSETQGVLRRGLLANVWLVLATGVSTLMLLAALYVPPLQTAFETVPLGGAEWGLVIGAALLGGVLLGVQRSVRRRVRRVLRRPRTA